MTDMTTLFTYGSLMFEPVWQHVVGASDAQPVPAIVRDYQRLRVRGETYPAMVAAAGEQVPGMVYTGVSAAQIALLDDFEGDDYRRITVNAVLSPTVSVSAQAYLCLDIDGLDPRPWDPDAFEAHHMTAFLATYGRRS